MPTLDWIGKKAVVNHHRDVPYRLLHCDKSKSVGDPDAGNLLVQGDNLEALKALLPYYSGKVKCIYIDPPYNTGNEAWVYNDNVNSPEIKAWLGSVVGKEAEDLSRHDKWLCMMYPRLRLLKEFLSDDGSIWISIDDNEAHCLKVICDEIFSRNNFISNVIWQKIYTVKNSARYLSDMHDHILGYAKSKENWQPNLLPRSESAKENYSNPDNDPRGVWTTNAVQARNFYSLGSYEIVSPKGKKVTPPTGTFWRVSKDNFERLDQDKRIWWGKGGTAVPRIKKFLLEAKDGVVPSTIWLHSEAGTNAAAKQEVRNLFGENDEIFDTPKPEKLMNIIVSLASNLDDIILDSFAGSGTTGAVAHKLGRKHLSIEMGEHAATHIVPRYKKVIEGETGGISSEVGWKGGGGFRFCTLGEALFDADGNVNPYVTFPDLAAHVFFCETGSPIPRKADASSTLIGSFQERAIYLLHSSQSMGVPSAGAGNVLNVKILESLPAPSKDFSGQRVVYAEGCTVPEDRLSAHGVTFKQVPYQIEGL